MAVEKREAGIVRHELNFSLLVATEHNHIFDDSCCPSSSEIGQVETVTVKMDGGDVVTSVPHAEPVTLPLLQMKPSSYQFTGHVTLREGRAVDGPAIEALLGGVVFGEGHLQDFVGRGGGAAGLRKMRVV